MELKKHPETQEEYWEAIEGLGGMVWRMGHDLGDGRIEETKGIQKDIDDMNAMLVQLVAEIEEKFNVIPQEKTPKKENPEDKLPRAPEGSIYYWDWYHKMKLQILENDYKALICSACPFAMSLDNFMLYNACKMDCGFSNETYRVSPCYFHICQATRSCEFSRIEKTINQQYGAEAQEAFTKKSHLCLSVMRRKLSDYSKVAVGDSLDRYYLGTLWEATVTALTEETITCSVTVDGERSITYNRLTGIVDNGDELDYICQK